MAPQIEQSILQIIHKGNILGTGFLVDRDLAVTCAHVVTGKDESVQVKLNGQESLLSARIIADSYREPNNGDIAFLHLDNIPENIKPLRLGAAGQSRSGSPFQSFGYPLVGQVEGIYARGELLGMVTESGQRLLQLRSVELNQGHSGAPVWDEKRGVVIGMIVSVYKSDASGKLRDTAFAVPSETLWQVCPQVRQSETAPYLGLQAFTDETTQFFFGREALTEKLLGTLHGGGRFLAVFGPSGSGKSSVVRAGLLSALKNGRLPGSQNWLQIVMRPTADPLEQMRTARLDPVDINSYLKLHPDAERVVLFIDQFEELFTLCPDDIRERFVRELASALENSKFILILSMRDEFYSAFHANAALLAESEHVKIENVPGTLKPDELIAMIERPAEMVGLALEEGLTELILNDLTRDGEARSSILPLLEFALTQLWERRRDGTLTHEAYYAIDGVSGSLARWADDTYSDLPKADQMLTESILTSLVHLGDEVQGLPDTRKRRSFSEFGDAAKSIIQHFVDRRLIVTSGDTVELIHDALVREWNRLREWIKKDHENLRLREGVSEAARQWDLARRDESLLNHRGPRLELALAMSKLPNYELTPLEQNYLDACLAAREKERITASRRRRNTYVGIAIAIIILTGWGFSYTQEQEQARLNYSRELAAKGISQLQFDPELSLLLAIEANKTADNSEAEDALRRALNESRILAKIETHLGAVWDGSFSPDGLYFVTTSTDQTAQVWDAKTYQPIGQPRQHEFFVERAVISPLCPDEHQYVLTASRDGTARIWTLHSNNDEPSRIIANPYPNHETYGVAISSDCKHIATANEHGMAMLWDFSGNLLNTYFSGEDENINTVEFSPDDKFILTASNDYAAYVWEVSTSDEVASEPKLKLTGHSGAVYSATYSGTGAYIVTASGDKTARMWRANSGELLLELKGHTNEVWYAELSPDVNFIVTASSDNSVRLWSTFIGVQIDEFRGHQGAVYAAKFSPDGKQLLTASEDQTARIWKATQDLGRFSFHGNWLTSVDLSPDNKLMVTAGRDNQAIIWNLADQNLSVFTTGPDNLEKYQKIVSQKLAIELKHDGPVNSARFSPDGKSVVTTSGTEAIIWDAKTGKSLRELSGNTEEVVTAKYSPDGELILTTSEYSNTTYGTVRIWDANTGKLLTTYYGPYRMGGINDASFSPDGEHIVAAVNDGMARVWKVDTAKAEITDPVMELKGHTQAIFSATYSHDGKYILTGGDNTARIWDAETGQLISILRGHNDLVYKASFDIDDQRIVTAGGDYRAIVWDVGTGRQLAEFRDHAGPVSDAIFSPDGKYIATASQDNLARLFVCDTCGSIEDLLALAQSRVLRELTCEERQIYLHAEITCPASLP